MSIDENHYWIFGATQVGDIVLSTSQSAKSSKVIRSATKGDFSHAAITATANTIIEALYEEGVISTQMARRPVKDARNVRVLRLDEAKHPNWKAIAGRAAEIAKEAVFDKYVR